MLVSKSYSSVPCKPKSVENGSQLDGVPPPGRQCEVSRAARQPDGVYESRDEIGAGTRRLVGLFKAMSTKKLEYVAEAVIDEINSRSRDDDLEYDVDLEAVGELEPDTDDELTYVGLSDGDDEPASRPEIYPGDFVLTPLAKQLLAQRALGECSGVDVVVTSYEVLPLGRLALARAQHGRALGMRSH